MKSLLLICLLPMTTIALAQENDVLSAEQTQQLEKIMKDQKMMGLKNQAFDAYKVNGMVAMPGNLKIAIVGTDPISVAFLKKHHELLSDKTWTIALIGSEQNLAQLRQAYPNLTPNIMAYTDDIRIEMMANALGINYYPALLINGEVYQ